MDEDVRRGKRRCRDIDARTINQVQLHVDLTVASLSPSSSTSTSLGIRCPHFPPEYPELYPQITENASVFPPATTVRL